jgi:hypothetical protein
MRLPRRKIRYRRRYVLIPILAMMIVPTLIIWSNTLNRPNVSGTNRDASLPSPFCRKGDPLAGIYNPLRFRVLSSCEKASGVVDSISSQADSSFWIRVVVDAKYSKLIGPGNISSENGLLVLEQSTTQDNVNVTALSVGERISFVGPLVYDVENQFNAICPIWSVTPL